MANQPVTNDTVGIQGPIVIDSTMPPTSSYEMLAAEGATVLVYSHDATLARVIRNVAADRYPIRIIDAWSDLLQLIESGKGRIVLLDVDAVSTDVEEALSEINRCSDWLVTIIAAKQQQAQDFMRFWSERRIHRLLIKPAAAGITRLLLESACARFIELRELHENTDSMEIPPGLLEAEQARETEQRAEKPGRKLGETLAVWRARAAALLKWTALAAVAGALLVGSAYVVEWFAPEEAASNDTAETNAEATPPTQDSPVDTQPGVAAALAGARDDTLGTTRDDAAFESVLQQAQAAENQGRVAAPPGDNAIDYYASILARAPDHAAARERLDAILERLFMSAEEQILDRDFAAAQATLEDIRRGNPAGTRLSFLSEQLAQMRAADAALDAAAQAPVAAPTPPRPAEVPQSQAELQSMVTLAALRLEEGSLIAPTGDSARDYLLRAVELGIDDAQLQLIADQFAARSVAAIRAALRRGDIAAATIMLETARELGSRAPELTTLAAEIDSVVTEGAREQEATLHARALQQIDAGAFSGGEDSAVELLARLRSAGADAAAIGEVEARLTNALSRSVREATDAGQWNEATAGIEIFRGADLDANVVRGLERDLAIAQRQAEFMANVAPAGELSLVESASAVYPRSAIAAGTTGWVEVHFSVDRNGVTRDVTVVDAEPVGEFEEAAIAALEQYRFEPFVLDGRTYERRLRLRMRFELD